MVSIPIVNEYINTTSLTSKRRLIIDVSDVMFKNALYRQVLMLISLLLMKTSPSNFQHMLIKVNFFSFCLTTLILPYIPLWSLLSDPGPYVIDSDSKQKYVASLVDDESSKLLQSFLNDIETNNANIDTLSTQFTKSIQCAAIKSCQLRQIKHGKKEEMVQ